MGEDESCGGIAGAVSCGISNVADGQIERFAQKLLEGANDMFNGFFTSWVTSDLDGIVGGSTADWFGTIALPIQAFLLGLGLMVAGVRMALSGRGEAAADAARRFFRAILVAVAGVAFFGIMQTGSSALASSILDAATGGQPPNLLLDAATFSSNASMALLFGLFGAIATGIQWIIMIFRAVAISVLLPFWPITAAGAMFQKQEGMFEKTTGWLLAFLLYSPVAAALYGLAIRFRDGRDGLQGAMVGMAIFALAIFALPALMRLVVPLTSAIGSASAGAMMMGGVKSAVLVGAATGSAIVTAGASAPASAAAASGSGAAAASGSGAAAASGSGVSGATGAAGAGTSGATGSAGATGEAGSTGAAGGSGIEGGTGSGAASGSSGSSGSSKSGWDSMRDLANAAPSGSRGVGEMIDE